MNDLIFQENYSSYAMLLTYSAIAIILYHYGEKFYLKYSHAIYKRGVIIDLFQHLTIRHTLQSSGEYTYEDNLLNTPPHIISKAAEHFMGEPKEHFQYDNNFEIKKLNLNTIDSNTIRYLLYYNDIYSLKYDLLASHKIRAVTETRDGHAKLFGLVWKIYIYVVLIIVITKICLFFY